MFSKQKNVTVLVLQCWQTVVLLSFKTRSELRGVASLAGDASARDSCRMDTVALPVPVGRGWHVKVGIHTPQAFPLTRPATRSNRRNE